MSATSRGQNKAIALSIYVPMRARFGRDELSPLATVSIHMPIWARCPQRIVATPNERFDPRDHEARRGKLCVSPVVAMVSIHVPMWVSENRRNSIHAPMRARPDPVSSQRSRRRSTRPCGRDFRPIGFPVSRRRFDLRAYEGAASRCSRRFRSTRPCGRDFRRIGFRRVGDDYDLRAASR